MSPEVKGEAAQAASPPYQYPLRLSQQEREVYHDLARKLGISFNTLCCRALEQFYVISKEEITF